MDEEKQGAIRGRIISEKTISLKDSGKKGAGDSMSSVIEVLISDSLNERIEFFSRKYNMAKPAMVAKLISDAVKFECRKYALEKYSEGMSINEAVSEAKIEPGELLSILDKKTFYMGYEDSETKLF